MGVPTGPPLFFVESVTDPELSDPDRHHAARVLRLRDGDALTVSDGRGAWRSCRFGPSLVLDGDPVVEMAPRHEITIGFALTKAAKPEFVVQKLTEAGVDRIVAFGAERSVVRWDDAKASARLERWRAVAQEAAMQSRRAWIPRIDAATSFAALAVGQAAGVGRPVLADLVGRRLDRSDHVVLIGPEGGWSDAERGLGLDQVRLGPHVLRAETAAVMAGGLAVALRDGLVGDDDTG